jgi:hypothetical protein
MPVLARPPTKAGQLGYKARVTRVHLQAEYPHYPGISHDEPADREGGRCDRPPGHRSTYETDWVKNCHLADDQETTFGGLGPGGPELRSRRLWRRCRRE